MSKIGRIPIALTSAKVNVKDQAVSIEGPKGKFSHHVPVCLGVELKDKNLQLSLREPSRENNMLWGLHRATLANMVRGVEQGFELNLTIVGLGFKAQVSGKKISLTLGYSHKIDYTLPEGVTAVVDKTGQKLTLNAVNKELLGRTADTIRAFKKPEPYKGTGIIREGEVVRRKAGKAKAAASGAGAA